MAARYAMYRIASAEKAESCRGEVDVMIRVLASLARHRQEYQFTDSQGKNESYETKPLTSYLGSKVDYMYTGQCTLLVYSTGGHCRLSDSAAWYMDIRQIPK